MWEFAKTTSPGGISMRRIFTFVLAAIAATFLWALVMTANVYAADASWNSTGSITYDGDSYTGPANDTVVKDLGLPEGSQVFAYEEPASIGGGSSQKMNIIYFTSAQEATNATSASYKTYTYDGTKYSNPSSVSSVAIGKQSDTNMTKGTTSCAIDGVGWIICPVTRFLAKGMDWIFTIISGFLAVRPVATDHSNSLYRAWTYMRSFANVAFVISFLIIIYSQLTNFGISNYGIKKLLPRLIIAAILVNLSYYICAIAVDISNILGYSIQGVFISMRNTLVGAEGNTWDLANWESVTGFILTGGTAAAALFVTLSTYGLVGSVFLLLPALAIGLTAALVAFLILAARQAIIVILIIISPLAFVAYLLPNTEKWFERWQSTLMTMLIIFPGFSIIFGGSQLASAAILQNANSINTLILGMLIQVAPLFLTPLLINMSGSLLGKIAGIVNNPNKGLVDRARKYSEGRAGDEAAKRLSTQAGKRQYLRRYAQYRDHSRRKRETQKKIHEGMADNRFSGSADNQRFHEQAYNVDTDKKKIEQQLERDLNTKIRNTPGMLKRELEVRIITDEASNAKGRIDRIHEEFRAGKDTSTNGALSALAKRSETATRDLALNAIATQTAKRVQQSNLSGALLKNEARVDGQLLRDFAGGIDENGADSSLAFAVKERRESIGKLIAERTELAKQFKLSGEQYQALATRTAAVVGIDDKGNEYTFSPDDAYSVEMAIANQLATGSFDEKYAIISKSGTGSPLEDYRASISRAIPANGIPNSWSAAGGKFINDVIKGLIRNEGDVIMANAEFIADGKFKAEALAANDPGAIKLLLKGALADTSNWRPEKQTDFNNNIQKLLDTASTIVNPDPNNKLYGQASQGTKNELANLIQRLSERQNNN